MSRRRYSTGSPRNRGSRSPTSRGPPIRKVKRDGRIEQFNRRKMISSIRSAGATQQEARLITKRVSNRIVRQEPIPSREVSTMIARSLSHVNPTASRNYAVNRDRKLAYNKRVNQLSSEITSMNSQAGNLTGRIENLDKRIQGLSGRIARIRQGNYHLLSHLETNQVSLSEVWTRISPELRTNANLKGEIVRTRIRDLQQALAYKMGGATYNLSNLREIESGIPQIRLDLSEMQNSIVTALSPLEKKYTDLDRDLRSAESTLSIVEGASFPWEEGETPVLAVKAKDLNNDSEGFITLTNIRFIFEHKKEIALKKMLFVVTEKKIVREAVVQKPIGMVTRLVKGKVGFFKG